MRRRDFIGGAVGVATAVTVAPGVLAGSKEPKTDPTAGTDEAITVGAKLPDAPPPWHLFAPLTAGSVVSQSLTLLSVSPVTQGGFTVELGTSEGVAARIAVCRASRSVDAVATTDQLGLLVVNGGHGRARTDESVAKAVVALASVIRSNEAKADADRVPVDTYEARVKHFGADVIG